MTGCSETETIDMTLDLPEIDDLVINDNKNCKNPNGNITVQMVGSVSDYDFMLIQQSPVQDTTLSNNPSFNGLDEGFYEVRAYFTGNDCGLYTSGETFEIKTTKTIDDITLDIAREQTACSFPYNGQLTAITADPSKYDWEWYLGTVTVGPTAVIVATDYITPDTLSVNLTNVYTVVATDPSSGCTYSESITLTENITPPVIAVSNVDILQHQTTCAPNGQVQISVGTPSSTAGYRFTLKQGSTILDSNFTGLFTGLEAGLYTALAEDTATNCVSDPSSVFEIENQIAPFGAIVFDETPQTNCNPASPDGALSVTVGGGTAGYTFKWFVGVDTSTAVVPQPSPTDNLTGIEAGNYGVRIFNQATGCDTVAFYTLTDESADYQETITATVLEDQIYCTSGVFSGKIEAGLTASASGGVPDTANYTYYWYDGTKTGVRNGSASLIAGENQSVINGLDIGWYSVRAVRNDGFGCAALDTAEVFVDDLRDFPVAGINIDIIEQTSCDSNNENGGLAGDVGGDTNGYVFRWFELDNGLDIPITDNNPNAVVNGFTVENLGTGTYILEVENTLTGCTGREQVYLGDNIIRGDEIRLNLLSTDASNCTLPNGEAFVNSIDLSEDGGATYTLTDDIANYSYQWYRGDDTSDPIALADNATAQSDHLIGVEPGEYTVLATSLNSTCPAIPYTVVVSSDLINNLTFDFSFTEQTDCINPDGGLEIINVAGGSGTYSYQWYKGATLSHPIAGADQTLLENIRSDKYTIEITDDNTGCSVDSTYTLPSSVTPVPPPALTIVDVNTCDPGSYNGEVTGEVDPLILAGIPKYVGPPAYNQDDFFYYWFEGKVEDGAVQYIDPSGDLDDPNNYLTFRNDPPVPGDNKRTISNLAPGWYTVIIVDAKQYVASGGTDPFECQSDARSFEVKAIAQPPVAIEVSKTPDTYCSGTDGQTVIEVSKKGPDDTTVYSNYDLTTATKDGSPYTFNPGDVSPVHDGGTETSTFTIINLEHGSYDFTFRDLETLCDTTITVEIQNSEIPPVLLSTDVAVISDQTSCNPINGEVAVTSPPSGVGALGDYTYYWYENRADFDPNNLGTADNVGPTWTNLEAGTYAVYARHNTTGCFSSFQELEIKDEITETQVEIDQTIANVDCSNAPEGSITVNAYELDKSSTTSTPAGGYTFNWFDESNNPVFSVDGLATSTISNLPTGAYRVEVINNDLGCVTITARDTIRFEPAFPEFTAASVSKQNVTTCDGDGSIEITEIMEDGVLIQSSDAAFADYVFEWHQGSSASAALPETSNVLSNLTVDTYYVYVTNTITGGCQSSTFLEISLEDSIVHPLIYEDSRTKFITCTGINEGEIIISVTEDDGSIPVGGYTFTWTDDSSNPIASVDALTSSTVSNLEAGLYEVLVTNPATGCIETASFEIETTVAKPILAVDKISDLFNCDPANGSAEVSALTFLGVASPYAGYDFVWTEGDLTTIVNTGTYGLTADGRSANQLNAGVYFVTAVSNTGTGCESLPVQVTIADSTETLAVVLDNISDPIIACDPSDDPEGSIEIEVLNSSDIITRWYEGGLIADPADSLVGFSNSLEIEDLVPGTYTVWVQDISSGCATTRTYNIEGVAVPITVSTSSVPFSSCITPNGQVVANVNGGSGSYRYQWVDSQGNVLPVQDDANMVTGLENGNYTVQVSDRNEPDCATADSDVSIRDARGNEIMVEVTNDFSVTNCDVANPNGQLSASADGDLSRYDFFWYEGETATGNPIAQGPTASALAPNTYSVVARDKVTGCMSEPAIGMVASDVEDFRLPTPTAELLSPVTRCTYPDGSAIVILDSTMVDPTAVYEYTWYNEGGREVFRSTRTNIVRELAAGEYDVFVTNLVSGCYAESASVTIPENIRIPNFEIVTSPSTCTESTGTAQIIFNESFNVVDIEWLTPNGYSNHIFLIDQPPGEYEVTVTDDKGCSFTQTATIESLIYTFNGVSPNGDGNNDKFIISCIEDFANNTVRIYNRTGAIVYENMNYDNQTSYFEGFGNRGLYLGGEKLPDGTYFYIIDKNNGDEPQSGYLELMR
ncbi:MAG: gliding motility-associated C-terminal domain-containing protein [Cyclobacteriaceae bacterium]